MRTELRFLLAVGLMMAVLVGTNYLFPPILPDEPVPEEAVPGSDSLLPTSPEVAGEDTPTLPPSVQAQPPVEEEADIPTDTDVEAPPTRVPERTVMVEGPLYSMEFSNYGAVARSVRLLSFQSFQREGAVELVPEEGSGILGSELVVGADTVDLTGFGFTVTPADGLTLSEGGGPETLTFRYDHPTGGFFAEVRYTFTPDSYVVGVEGEVPGLDRAALFIDLGPGIAYNEVEVNDDIRVMSYATHHLQDGIDSRPLTRVQEPEVEPGPLRWAAVKSKFFVEAILPGSSEDTDALLGGVWADPTGVEDRPRIRVAAPVGGDGQFEYRAYLGPIERARLLSFGNDLEEVNPYGWRLFRPIIRPFVGVILWILNYLHDQLLLGYGWVLITFGVGMRVVLFPLNHKAMKAQLKNMAAQPLLAEIQKKYKNDPERLQKEMMKLYKEHGFNPLAGCLPMLLPWPVLIALFFVFQNTIELRGEAFLWLPDLSAPDPLYLLPVFMAVSMFLMQWINVRSIDQPNPQLKMMMWVMPIVLLFIFFSLPAGLNLYYATVNIATIPQQYWIAQQRKKVKPLGTPQTT